MISGFSNMTRPPISYGNKHIGDGQLPVPFNIPNVLQNLLFADIDLIFDAKQRDVMEALRFSYNSLEKMQQRYAQKENDIVSKMIQNPQDEKLQSKLEEVHLDRYEAYEQFKNMVETIAELLTREQYQKLLKFSGIKV
jgi:hypothetical protein